MGQDHDLALFHGEKSYDLSDFFTHTDSPQQGVIQFPRQGRPTNNKRSIDAGSSLGPS
jgi:hypothetical protein